VASYSRRSLQNNFLQKVLLAISHTLPEDQLGTHVLLIHHHQHHKPISFSVAAALKYCIQD